MRRLTDIPRTLRRYGAAITLALLVPVIAVDAQGAEVLTNESITAMIAGKLSRDLITTKINASRPGFDVTSDGIIALYGAKVDPTVIKVMIEAGQAAKKRGDAPSSLVGLDETMTNDAVIRLVTAKVQKQIILTKIQIGKPSFDVSTTGLVTLSQNKVPQDIIKVMMSPAPPPPAAPAATTPAKKPPTK